MEARHPHQNFTPSRESRIREDNNCEWKNRQRAAVDWLYTLPEGRSLADTGWFAITFPAFILMYCQLSIKYCTTENVHTVIVILHYFLFSFILSSFMVSLFSQLVNTCLDTIIQNRGVNTARGTRQCSIRPCQVSKQLLLSFSISISNWWMFMISTYN